MFKKFGSLLVLSLLLAGCQAPAEKTENTSQETTTQAPAKVEETKAASEKTQAGEEIKVGLTIKADDKVIKEIKDLKVSNQDSLLDIMKEQMTLKENDGFIQEIEGHAQDEKANKWWLFTVNGEMAEVGAADLYLKDGDLVEWNLSTIE